MQTDPYDELEYELIIEGPNDEGSDATVVKVPVGRALSLTLRLAAVTPDWIEDGWTVSARGNDYRQTDDNFHVIIYKQKSGKWVATVDDLETRLGKMVRADSSNDAKREALKLLETMRLARKSKLDRL